MRLMITVKIRITYNHAKIIDDTKNQNHNTGDPPVGMAVVAAPYPDTTQTPSAFQEADI